MTLTGHKTWSVFDRYHIVSETDLAEAGKRLDKVFLSRTTTNSTTINPSEEQTEEILQ